MSSAGDNEASGNGQDEELRLQPEATNKDALGLHHRKGFILILMFSTNSNLPSADDNGASANGQDEEMRLQPEGTNKNA